MNRLLRAALLVSAVPLFAQQPLMESIEVRVTNVDVVVTDAQGHAVSGLGQDDFEILENGKPQQITNFYEISETTAATAEETAGQERAVAPAEMRKRKIVIFVDNYSIHPLARNRAFDAVEKSLDSLMRPGDEATIVFWNRRLEVMVPFTSDRAELLARFREARRTAGGGMSLSAARARIVEHAAQMIADANQPNNRSITHAQAYAESTAAARVFAEELYASENALIADLKRTLTTLAGVEGKKVMIYLGAEMPDNPGLELFQQIDSMFQSYIRNIRPAIIREQGRKMSGEIRAVAHSANANGVTMYMVDTAERGRSEDPTGRVVEPDVVFFGQTNTPVSMATIAAITGGVSVPGGKSFEQALETVARDLSSYYSLGYKSPAEDGNRRLEVKVKRPGLRVRSRASYTVRNADQEVEDRVVAALFHTRVMSDFPISIAVGQPEQQPGGQFKVPVTVTFPSSITLIPQDDSLVGEFAVFIATATEGGALSQVSKSVQPVKFPANAAEAIRDRQTFTYTASLLVRPGEQFVSVSVVDRLAGTSGYARAKIVAR